MIEGEAYKKELLGGQKEPETVAGVIRAARLLKFKFGRVDVNIGTLPRFSPLVLVIAHVRGLRFHGPQAMPSPSSSSLPTSTSGINCVLRPDLMILLRAASYRPLPIGTQLCHLFSWKCRLYLRPHDDVRVLYECNKVTVARPTALVATALLTHTGRGLPITQLRNKVLQLRQMIIERGGFVASLKVSEPTARASNTKRSLRLHTCVSRRTRSARSASQKTRSTCSTIWWRSTSRAHMTPSISPSKGAALFAALLR